MELSRRGFVGAVLGVAGCVAVGVPLTAKGFMIVESATSGDGPFDAGEVAKIAEGFTDTFAQSNQVILLRKGDTVFAMSSACPHQGYTIRVAGDGLRCPGHGSRFDAEGKVTRGPATGQLARHGVEITDGKLWIDTGKIFLAGEFEKDGASVKVK